MWRKAKLYSSMWWKRQRCSSSSEEGEVRTSSNWSEKLPLHIIQVILQKLNLPDYIRCGAVCPSWRSAAVDMAMARKSFHLAPQLPWLMLPTTTYCESSTSAIDHHFLSLSEDHKLYKTNCGMDRQLCVGSIEGWLIMLDNVTFAVDQDHTTYNMFNLFFLNPISGAKAMLPPESTIPPKLSKLRSCLHKVVASSVPTSPHCLVASHHSTGRLAFCRPSDKSWTVIDGDVFTGLEEEEFYDIEVIDKKLYVLVTGEPGFLFVFDIHLDSSGAHTYTAGRLVMLHPCPAISLPAPVLRDGVVHASGCEHVTYLFKDSTSKELFMTFISKSYSYRDGEEFRLSVNDPHTDGFRVFKLEHDNGPRWIETTNLGNRILFLSMASRFLIPSDINLNYFGPYGKTLDRNRIYFVFEGGHDLGIFSLTDKSIERYTFPFPKDHYSTRRSPIWFTPNFW